MEAKGNDTTNLENFEKADDVGVVYRGQEVDFTLQAAPEVAV
jgi:hypothetical protein